MESPLRLTAHGGLGEGNEETRPSRGGKVRFVSTLRGGRLETQVMLCAGRLPLSATSDIDAFCSSWLYNRPHIVQISLRQRLRFASYATDR
jgi:hypothetical protein